MEKMLKEVDNKCQNLQILRERIKKEYSRIFSNNIWIASGKHRGHVTLPAKKSLISDDAMKLYQSDCQKITSKLIDVNSAMLSLEERLKKDACNNEKILMGVVVSKLKMTATDWVGLTEKNSETLHVVKELYHYLENEENK